MTWQLSLCLATVGRERRGGEGGSVLVFAFYMNSDGAENPFVLTLLRQSDTAQGVAYQI